MILSIQIGTRGGLQGLKPTAIRPVYTKTQNNSAFFYSKKNTHKVLPVLRTEARSESAGIIIQYGTSRLYVGKHYTFQIG
jgi:hypothetical protein